MPRRNRIQDEIESDQEPAAALTRNDSIRNDDEDEGSPFIHRATKQSTRPGASKTKTKLKSEKRTTHQRNAEDSATVKSEVKNDAVIPFNRDEFLSTTRLIPRTAVVNIDNVMSDLQHLINQVGHVGFDLVTETAMAIGEASGNTKEGEEVQEKLDLLMRNLIDAQEELKAHEQSLDGLKQQILREELIDDLEKSYLAKAEQLKGDYAKKTSRQKYARHEKYFGFRERVWEVNHEDAMPPLKDLIPPEDNDSEDDSDIEVGGKTQDYKCPLTLSVMENPVTSAVCGHSFSMEGIRDYLGNGRKRTTCPATGCQQLVALTDFKCNEQLARRVADHVRRARRKEDESDDDNAEVVD